MGCAMNLVGMDIELLKAAMNLGGVVFFGTLIMLLLYRLMSRFGGSLVGAIVKASDAMTCQAQCISELKDCIKQQAEMGGNDHREIILGQQVMAEEMKRMIVQMQRLEDGRE